MTFHPKLDDAFPLDVLAWNISRNAGIVSQHLASNGLAQPSCDRDGPRTVLPSSAPEHVREARQKLISASLEILQLAIGPSEFVPNLALGFQHVSCVSWLCQYDIFRLIPLDSSLSYSQLARMAQVPEQRLKSIIRMAMTAGLFRESADTKSVGHSATSAHLAAEDGAHAWASYVSNKSAPMALSLASAQKRWGADSVEKHETAYNVAFGTDLPFFDHLSRDETNVKAFAAYMKHVRASEGVDIKHLVSGYEWESIKTGGVVVDVGGSSGSAALTLAKAFPQLKFVVQDLPANTSAGSSQASQVEPPEILSRVSWQGHDFTQPQPVKGAVAYLLRMILHDWPDVQARTILQQLVAAMTPSRPGKGESGSRLLIMDTVLPDVGSVPLSEERIMRVRDMTMLQAFNSKEREMADWLALLASVDRRLRVVNVVRPYASDMSVLEVELGGEEEVAESVVNGVNGVNGVHGNL